MASQHQPTEVFRFLNVRNPKMISSLNDKSTFIYYAPEGGTNEFYDDLVGIKIAAEEGWKDGILDAVNVFKASGDYFNNVFILNLIFPDFFAINEFLLNNELPTDMTLADWLIENYTIDVSSFFTPEVNSSLQKIWNNIFAQSISPDKNEALDQSVMLLRVANLLKLSAESDPVIDTIEGIRKSLNALVLLPYDLFPISFFSEIPDSSEEGEGGTGINLEEVALYKKIKLAIYELEIWFNNKITELKETIPTVSLSFNEDGTIPTEVQAYMDARDAFLEDINDLNNYQTEYAVAIGTNFGEVVTAIGEDMLLEKSKDQIMSILSEKANQLFMKNSANPKKGLRVTVIGKSIVEETADSCACCNPSLEQKRVSMGRIGIGDFYKVEQQLQCYKPAEIAHVENIMMGETRNRETRRLDRYEEITVTETETITETEKDHQTTSRSEQEVNTESVAQQNQSLSAGLNLSGNYGNVTFNSSFNYSSGSSSTTITANATHYARTIVERARQLEIKRLRTEKTVKIFHEYEETNTHTFTNEGDQNQVGVYRWLDKFYYNRLINYGPHLMFEFIIPEPAFFHLFAKKINQNANQGVALTKPIPPNDASFAFPLHTHFDLDRNNYTFWSSYYGESLENPPQAQVILSKAYSDSPGAGTVVTKNDDKIMVPEGYQAVELSGQLTKWGADPIVALIGASATIQSPNNGWGYSINPVMLNEEGSLGVTYLAKDHHCIEINIRCTLKTDAYNAWKATGYQKIWTAYYSKLKDYNDQLNTLQQQLSFSPSYGTNPAFYREIEKMELKKNCLEMFMEPRFKDYFDAVNCPTEDRCSQPELNKAEIEKKSEVIRFFETAFEWDQMTYEFYQYFWGRKCKWVELYNLSADDDPLFQKFLQAGAARVVIPVRKGREASVMYFQETGIMIDTPLSLIKSEHINANVELINDSKFPVIVNKWTTKMPTNLVALECVSACINELDELTGMPCFDANTLDDELPGHE